MLKKIILIIITLIAVICQMLFIYVFGYSGGKQQVENLWQSFDVEPMVYSVWVLNWVEHKMMWLLPIVCLSIGIWVAYQKSHIKAFLGVAVSVIATLLLYASLYWRLLMT